ncbi:MAG: hypothetical protein ACYCV7_08915 [Acidimicrobiales bacterium]
MSDGLFELRFNLGSNTQRITFFFPGDHRVVLLTLQRVATALGLEVNVELRPTA